MLTVMLNHAQINKLSSRITSETKHLPTVCQFVDEAYLFVNEYIKPQQFKVPVTSKLTGYPKIYSVSFCRCVVK